MFMTHWLKQGTFGGQFVRPGLLVLLLWLGAHAHAQPLQSTPAPASLEARADILRIDPTVVDAQLTMDIDTDLSLNSTMRQALERGLPLFFSIEVEISQPRWWWLNKTMVDTTLTRRLSFNNLTQQWRVSTGDLSITLASFEEALVALRRVRNWPVALSDRFNPETNYKGRVRIRLDTTQLARPLQLDPANRHNLTLSSPWKAFEFMIRRPTADAS